MILSEEQQLKRFHDAGITKVKKFKFVGGGAIMLKRISEYKDFRIEVLETIKRIKGGTYDK